MSRISNIREDTATLTTYLTAKIAPWSDVAGTYEMDFGKAIPFKQPNQLQTRGLWDDIKGVVTGAENDIKKGVDYVASKIEGGASTVASDVAKVANFVGNAVVGNVDLSKSVTFGMNAGTPNKSSLIFSDK